MKMLFWIATLLPREMRKNAVFIVCFLLSAFLFLFLANLEHLEHEESRRRMTLKMVKKAQLMRKTRSTTTTTSTLPANGTQEVIRLIGWTKKFTWKDGWFSEGKYAFKKCNLPPEISCTYTSDKSKLMESDVVLIRIRKTKDKSALPATRLPHQKWLFFESEPPTKTWSFVPSLNPADIKDVFNLTSTYAYDSDIPSRLEMKCTPDDAQLQSLKTVNFAAEKSRGVAWFVSHCETQSKREAYVKQLQKHIEVDVYGACGPYHCDDAPFGNKEAVSSNNLADCDSRVLNTTYKFYLAFENSLCDHYITEKLTRLFIHNINIIPVVMGKEDYNRLLPPGSFIDIKDFDSPKTLAEHLKRVDEDDDLYNEYIQNKMAVHCDFPREVLFECRLCEYLHQHKHLRQTVHDAAAFWGVQERCLSPGEYFAGIADEIAA